MFKESWQWRQKYKEVIDPLTNYFGAIRFRLKVHGVCHSPQYEREPKKIPVLCPDLLKEACCLWRDGDCLSFLNSLVQKKCQQVNMKIGNDFAEHGEAEGSNWYNLYFWVSYTSCCSLVRRKWKRGMGTYWYFTGKYSSENGCIGKPAEGVGKLFPELCLLWK